MSEALPGADYPYRTSLAAKALSDAIDRKHGEISLRQMAGHLGYRSAVVLSHMRTGRLPIPVERAEAIAEAVGLPPAAFLSSVLKQRFPNINFSKLGSEHLDTTAESTLTSDTRRIIDDLEAHAGCHLEDLSNDHQAILRELVAEPRPRRRWLTVYEAKAFDAIRKLRPDIARDGLTAADRLALSKTREELGAANG